MNYWDDSDRLVVRRVLDIIAERRFAYYERHERNGRHWMSGA